MGICLVNGHHPGGSFAHSAGYQAAAVGGGQQETPEQVPVEKAPEKSLCGGSRTTVLIPL